MNGLFHFKKLQFVLISLLCITIMLLTACAGQDQVAIKESPADIQQETSSAETAGTEKPSNAAEMQEQEQTQESSAETGSTETANPLPEQSVQGIVTDALMNTLVIAAEDGHTYQFSKMDVPVSTESTGILIGNPAIVHYYGQLDPNRDTQNVEVISIEVFDAAEQNPSDSQEETGISSAQERAEELLAQMTLKEKVGQMFIARCPETDATQKAADCSLGGYILFARDFENKTADQVQQNIASYQNAASIPLLIGVDEEGGTVNRISRYSAFRSAPFQSPQALFAAGGLDAVRNDTTEKCQLLHNLGINLNFAPVCDVSTNPDDFIYKRSFGKDCVQTAEYVETVVNEMKRQNMGAVLKHFPGYGNNADTHTGIAYDERPYETFTNSDFLPFQAGIDAGANVVLVSHNIVNSIDDQWPASLSPQVHEILRKELGFDGVIITDDLYMDGVRHFADDKTIAVQAVQAGNDLLCCTDFEIQIPAVLEAIQAGTISETRIDESVRRILMMKIELGILS